MRCWLAVVALLAAHGLAAVFSVRDKTVTCDEIAHLTAGVYKWKTGDFRLLPEHPPLVHLWAAFPVLPATFTLPDTDHPDWWRSNAWLMGRRFLYESGNDAQALLLRGRVMVVLLSIALGLVVFLWSRHLFGDAGGLLSLVLYALSPTMLAHGSLVTTDTAVSLFFLLALAAIWKVLHRVSPGTVWLGALAVAGLLLAKVSGVLILPMAAVLVLVRLLSRQPLLVFWSGERQVRSRATQLAAWLAAAVVQGALVVVLIWAAHGFRYPAMRAAVPGRDRFYTPAALPPGLDPWEYELSALGQRGELLAWLRDHKLLPEAYLFGLASTVRHAEERSAFLNGESRSRGWWYFFPYCFLVKTPLPLFGVLVVAAAAAWTGFRRSAPGGSLCGVGWSGSTQCLPAGRQGEPSASPLADPCPNGGGWHGPAPCRSAPGAPGLDHATLEGPNRYPAVAGRAWQTTADSLYRTAPLWVLFVVYWVTAITSHLNIGHRHILPTYPVLFIVCGQAAAWLRGAVWMRRAVYALALAYLGCFVISWPNYLAYFNLLVGGPSNGYKHLVDSSLDWGQDLPELKRRLDQYQKGAAAATGGGTSPVYLSYFGTARPPYYGIEARMLPSFLHWDQVRYTPLTGGLYCISATTFQQVGLLPECRWTPLLEGAYQELRRGEREVAAAAAAGAKAPTVLDAGDWQLLNKLRFARLCAFLRQRQPDDQAGHSILIFRLSADLVRQAVEGPPPTLLPDRLENVRRLAEECASMQGHVTAAGFYLYLLETAPGRLEAPLLDNAGAVAERLLGRGRPTEGVALFRAVLRHAPDHVKVLNNLAWFLATTADETRRDGTEARCLGEHAATITARRDPNVLDTLAAALAETGRFDEAVPTAEQAVQLATALDQAQLAEEIRGRLKLYRKRTPFRTR